MSDDQNQKEYIITLPAEVELELTVKAENFHEAVEKALEIAENPWTINDYDPDLFDVTWHAAEVAGVTLCHDNCLPDDFQERIKELFEPGKGESRQANVVDFRPLQQLHSNKDEG